METYPKSPYLRHYKIVNILTSETLAESDYYDYLEILLREIKELHKCFCDTSKIVIVSEILKRDITGLSKSHVIYESEATK